MSSSSSPEVEQEVYPDGSSSSSSSSEDPPMASPMNDTQLPPMDEPEMDENDVKEIVAGTDPVWYFLAFVLVAALFIYLVFYRRKGNTSEEDDDFFATLDIEKVCVMCSDIQSARSFFGCSISHSALHSFFSVV
jgi:hypothetical protein